MTAMKIRRLALLGILGAAAVVLSFLESALLPDIPFLPPGAKPGLSNIVTMFTATFAGFGGALYITLIKAVFAFATRGATAFFMSLSGGILSCAALCLLLRIKKETFSFSGIGVICAVMHNLGQLAVACIITSTASLLYYVPLLLLFAVASGLATGTVLRFSLPPVQRALRGRYI